MLPSLQRRVHFEEAREWGQLKSPLAKLQWNDNNNDNDNDNDHNNHNDDDSDDNNEDNNNHNNTKKNALQIDI